MHTTMLQSIMQMYMHQYITMCITMSLPIMQMLLQRLMLIKKLSKRRMELLLKSRSRMMSLTYNHSGIKRKMTPAGRRHMDEVLEFTKALAQPAK